MRILVVGKGAREHALAAKLASNPTLDRLYAAPGNPGMAQVASCVPLDETDVGAIADFAESSHIDLTVVGPEAPLVAGLADELASRGLRVFGPSRAAARLEASKSYMQDVASRHGIPVAAGRSFDDPGEALDYVRRHETPIVVKADGLAAGKGVRVCATRQEARDAIDAAMRQGVFGAAGRRIVVQECLTGREASLFVLTDGTTALPLDPVQDYKRALDGDRGPNTGGMGAYSPVTWLGREQRDLAVRTIIEPLLGAMDQEGARYTGCLYAGVFFTPDGPRLYEVNCRFGDPECQVLVGRMASDLAEAALACAEGNLGHYRIGWHDEAAVCVVIAAPGYEADPSRPRTGDVIEGVEEAQAAGGVSVFHAGTAVRDGKLVSASGRVLSVVAYGRSHAAARERAYRAVGRIRLPQMHYRTDIGRDLE